MKASVIIATYNRSDYLLDLIASLRTQSLSGGFEILVMDNSLDGRNKNYVDSVLNDQIKYIWEKRPGSARARNTGALEAKGEILVFLDDDELLCPNFMALITAPFDNPKVGCVGGKMLPKFEVETFPEDYSLFDRSDVTHLDLGEEPRILEKPWEEIWGGNMAVRRDVFLKVGGQNPDLYPDEMIWLTGDGECGLQYKVRQAGYKIFYQPSAYLYNRINADRLTKEFLIKRRTYRALSMSYTHVRALKNSRFFALRMIVHAVRCYLKAFYYYFVKKFSSPLQRKIESLFWEVRARHHLSALFDRKFRDYIQQESYL